MVVTVTMANGGADNDGGDGRDGGGDGDLWR